VDAPPSRVVASAGVNASCRNASSVISRVTPKRDFRNPHFAIRNFFAPLAQLVERVTLNEQFSQRTTAATKFATNSISAELRIASWVEPLKATIWNLFDTVPKSDR
jgi:hypothetical protein